MVDCRPAGAAPHELAHSASNGAPQENHHNQQQASAGGAEVPPHGMPSPATARSSTPATTNAISTYTGGMNPPGGAYGGGGAGAGAGGVCAQYVCGVKSVVWMAPQGHAAGALLPAPHAPPPPPHNVNPHVHKSVHANGADLPMNDIPTLRYYFNLGVECMWAAYGPPPPPHHLPPRHYSPRDLAQDLQQISLHERPVMNHNSGGGEQNHKHKPPANNDKPQVNNQGKGNGQRPLLGPRFKRGGNNQDGNQNNNQNKGHNNNMGNKGPNNRRNSHGEPRGPHVYGAGGPPPADDCVMDQPMLTLPYIPYPPPIYPIPYYPVDSDPAMMGMMGGMGYVGYDEGMEYSAPLQYYGAGPPPPPPPHYAPPLPHPPHLPEHK